MDAGLRTTLSRDGSLVVTAPSEGSFFLSAAGSPPGESWPPQVGGGHPLYTKHQVWSADHQRVLSTLNSKHLWRCSAFSADRRSIAAGGVPTGLEKQVRVIQLLVQRVVYDGAAGTVSVTFRPSGIRALEGEPDEQEAAA